MLVSLGLVTLLEVNKYNLAIKKSRKVTFSLTLTRIRI
jgi:hypothetical protein